jgi:hypothetical protein
MSRTATVLRIAGAALVALLVVGAPPMPVAAGTLVPDVEVWLDRPLPTDARAGQSVAIGGMIWHPESGTTVGRPSFVRVHPAAGAAQPVEVPTSEDWPGHFVALVVVPSGGIAEVEIGTAGSACVGSTCTRSDALYAIAGVGPPPGIDLTAIAEAEISLPGDLVVAGRPATVTVRIEPLGPWDPALLPLPDAVAIQVRRPREPVLVEAVAELADAGTRTYRAVVIVPDDGDVLVQAGVAAGDEDGTRAPELFAAIVRLTVAPPDDPTVTTAPGAQDPDEAPASGPGAVGGVVLIGFGFIALAGVVIAVAARHRAR